MDLEQPIWALHGGQPAETERDALGDILRSNCNYVRSERPLTEAMVRYLERAAEGAVETIEFEVLDGHMDGSALVAGLPEGEERAWVARDVERWGKRMAELTGQKRFHAMFSQVTNDKCRKFHGDYVMLRLLVTYAGPGTEIAPDMAVNREALEEPAHCHIEANEAILREPGAVIHALAGDVVLLKGERWPGNTGRAAIHRSPPITERKLRRLVLTLTCFGAEGRPW